MPACAGMTAKNTPANSTPHPIETRRLQARVDLLGLHAHDRQRYPVLLESASGGDWDILFALPQRLTLYHVSDLAKTDFFGYLEREVVTNSAEQITSDLPFRGGWFLYLGYELAHQLEPSVATPALSSQFPLAGLIRAAAAVMVNRQLDETVIVCETQSGAGLAEIQRDIAALKPSVPIALPAHVTREEDPDIFLAGVARIKEYIRAGDVFQVNLARRWRSSFDSPINAATLYRRLRASNPAPFSGIADFGQQQIVSSSPERLVRVQQSRVQTRPIAGTHPRSDDPAEDDALRQRLRTHPKERAEHIMLVDLERNDLGKICQPGSVAVNALMQLATYTHVHHIESEICGVLRRGISPAAVLRALFPGGTITGCPKVRTMQIIAELEASPRIAYTGSMGYINHNGDMDLNILIRSFMVDGTELTFKAGAGIVADSDAARELEETRAKAKGLLRALV